MGLKIRYAVIWWFTIGYRNRCKPYISFSDTASLLYHRGGIALDDLFSPEEQQISAETRRCISAQMPYAEEQGRVVSEVVESKKMNISIKKQTLESFCWHKGSEAVSKCVVGKQARLPLNPSNQGDSDQLEHTQLSFLYSYFQDGSHSSTAIVGYMPSHNPWVSSHHGALQAAFSLPLPKVQVLRYCAAICSNLCSMRQTLKDLPLWFIGGIRKCMCSQVKSEFMGIHGIYKPGIVGTPIRITTLWWNRWNL